MRFLTRFRRLLSHDDATGWRRALAWTVTVLAGLLVLFALVAPNQVDHLTPAAFVRIPLEGIVGAALVLALPPKPRRIMTAVAGALLGLLTIVKFADMGFFTAFDRPWDPVSDWSFVSAGIDLLTNDLGHLGAIVVVAAIALLVAVLLVVMALSALRLTDLAAGHRTATTRTVAVLTAAWLVCAMTGAQLTSGQPIASTSAAGLAYAEARQVRTEIQDQRAFTKEVATDAFRNTPADELLAGLRGKDVLLTFVESYGRVAIQDSDIAPHIDALLDDGTNRLHAAGFSARSAFLTSPTFGGGSWLAHSTLQSGVWINGQKRYDELMKTDRLTLSSAFGRAGWQTVADVPAHFDDWPDASSFYHFNRYYDARNVGYQGPKFSYASMTDQFVMSKFQQNEMTPGHAPLMAEIDLVSSHWPWAPLPQSVDWNAVGDGSVFNPMPGQGQTPDQVWTDKAKIRAAYGESIEYSLNTLISYLQNYGNDNTVLVFLGDHQPDPAVSGAGASRDVPITIVARDPAVLDRIAGWNWQDGLRPDPKSPVWQMSTFRDKFLTAFGPQAPPTR